MKQPEHKHETSGIYASVVTRLSEQWRVIICKDGIQWILQRREKLQASRPWRGVRYCTTKKALIRVSTTLCGPIDPKSANILATLPERAREIHMIGELAA